jgi:hypothetical protein
VSDTYDARLAQIERVLAGLIARVRALEAQVDAERIVRELAERTMEQIDRHDTKLAQARAELQRVEAELAMLAAPHARRPQ